MTPGLIRSVNAFAVLFIGCALLHAHEGEAVPPARPGTLVMWGDDGGGNLNSIPGGLFNVQEVAIGRQHGLALRYDRSVAMWGYSGYTNVPANVTNVVQVATSGGLNVALIADGTVRTWEMQMGHLPASVLTSFPGVTEIAAGDSFIIGLTPAGEVAASSGLMMPPSGLNNVKAIAAGRAHALALKRDGTVVGWSDFPGHGAAQTPPGLKGVVLIRALHNQSAAFQADGTLVLWGQTPSGAPASRLKVGIGVVDFALSESGVVVLKSDGTVQTYGHAPLPELKGATSLASGFWSVGAIVPNGLSAPIVTKKPARGNLAVLVGRNIVFRTDASGTGDLSFQWFRGGAPIPGQTSSNLVIRATVPDTGAYTMRVTDVTGSSVTEPVYVTVGHTLLAPLASDAAINVQNGEFGFTFEVTRDKVVQAVQTSTDLRSWTDITNAATRIPNTTYRYSVDGLPVDDADRRFYRVVILPY